MAKSFVLNDFLRHLDPRLLDAYCARHGILLQSTSNSARQSITSEALTLFQELPPQVLATIETDFRLVNELATRTAQTMLIEFAHAQDLSLPTTIADLSQYDTALWFFLHAPSIFSQVAKVYELEDVIGWREFLVPKLSPKQVLNQAPALQSALQTYLLSQEHRGGNCIVEQTMKDSLVWYIAYPEDYAKVDVVYSRPQQLNKRKICKPVQRLFFRYDLATGTLGIKGFRSFRKLEIYRQIFCQTVLGIDSHLPERYLCNLDLLMDPQFHMAYGPELERVIIKSVTVSIPSLARTITLEFSTEAPEDIPELHQQFQHYNLPLEQIIIIRVKFNFKFNAALLNGSRGSVTSYLAVPNAHNLSDKPLHHRVMAYFKQWGLYQPSADETPTQPAQV